MQFYPTHAILVHGANDAGVLQLCEGQGILTDLDKTASIQIDLNVPTFPRRVSIALCYATGGR